MKTTQHTAEQIIKILEQAEKGDQTIAAVCRAHGIAENTFYRWRNAYGGMAVSEVQRLKELENENGRLKRLLAERVLELDLLKELLQKRADAGGAKRGRPVLGGGRLVGAARVYRGADASVELPVCRAPHRRYAHNTFPRFRRVFQHVETFLRHHVRYASSDQFYWLCATVFPTVYQSRRKVL